MSHQVRTGDVIAMPSRTVRSPGRSRSLWPRMPRACCARFGAGTATSSTSLSSNRKGSRMPSSRAAVTCEKNADGRARVRYAWHSSVKPPAMAGPRTPQNGRARSVPRSRPSPIPFCRASPTLNGCPARGAGRGIRGDELRCVIGQVWPGTSAPRRPSTRPHRRGGPVEDGPRPERRGKQSTLGRPFRVESLPLWSDARTEGQATDPRHALNGRKFAPRVWQGRTASRRGRVDLVP